MLQVLAKRLKANLIIMTHSAYEITVQAPKGYVWADNGQEEIHDQQWNSESRKQIKQNVIQRMQKGLMKA